MPRSINTGSNLMKDQSLYWISMGFLIHKNGVSNKIFFRISQQLIEVSGKLVSQYFKELSVYKKKKAVYKSLKCSSLIQQIFFYFALYARHNSMCWEYHVRCLCIGLRKCTQKFKGKLIPSLCSDEGFMGITFLYLDRSRSYPSQRRESEYSKVETGRLIFLRFPSLNEN